MRRQEGPLRASLSQHFILTPAGQLLTWFDTSHLVEPWERHEDEPDFSVAHCAFDVDLDASSATSL